MALLQCLLPSWGFQVCPCLLTITLIAYHSGTLSPLCFEPGRETPLDELYYPRQFRLNWRGKKSWNLILCYFLLTEIQLNRMDAWTREIKNWSLHWKGWSPRQPERLWSWTWFWAGLESKYKMYTLLHQLGAVTTMLLSLAFMSVKSYPWKPKQ